MNEREMLEFAAKAVGIKGEYSDGVIWHKNEFGDDVGFNPLEDDGSALRLAVDLDIDVLRNVHETIAVYDRGDIASNWKSEKDGDDKNAATRRAIVRAAAEVGKVMP